MMATRPVDFRKGVDGLAALVRDTMGADPFSGAVYVFRAKRADRVKLVFWDRTGVVLVAKRLEEGAFRWPRIEDEATAIQPGAFQVRQCARSITLVLRPQCRLAPPLRYIG
jgi:transposase